MQRTAFTTLSGELTENVKQYNNMTWPGNFYQGCVVYAYGLIGLF